MLFIKKIKLFSLGIFIFLILFGLNSNSFGYEYSSNEEKNFIEVYEKTLPSIVSIEADIDRGTSGGTGCIISSSGIILTSSHVIEKARNIEVTTFSGKSYSAKILAILKSKNDLALIKIDTTEKDIEKAVRRSKYYKDAIEDEITTEKERIYDKLQIVNSEYLKWFEILLAFVFMIIGYMSQVWILKFQVKMRQLEMEDEVMQFQTIILMLMRIERINVEMILEWLERYSNIFRSQITRCVNNYEAGAWEALEVLKNEISYMPLIRIVESMQAAVEKIPIKDAFDELDSEREYYREKRKESNERLISKKGMIGKAIGFAPMVCLFVGYLIVPLVFIGLTSMSSTMGSMTSSSF